MVFSCTKKMKAHEMFYYLSSVVNAVRMCKMVASEHNLPKMCPKVCLVLRKASKTTRQFSRYFWSICDDVKFEK